MSRFKVRESLAYLRDIERIEIHLMLATGNASAAQKRIEDMRSVTLKLEEFPRLGPAREDLGAGVRLFTTSDTSVALDVVQEEAGIVLMLRTFYGGEDYEAVMFQENDSK
jgi:plasmid stabilization system protein ParE